MSKMKATLHMGRLKGKSNGKHNDRTFDTSKNKSITHPEDAKYNVYYVSNEEGKFIPVEANRNEFEKREIEFYREHFSDALKAKNERYRMQGHKERCKTITETRKAAKTSPMEIILQVGNEDNPYRNGTRFNQMTTKFAAHVRSVYPDFKILNLAIHYEETSVHAHIRGVFITKDKDGHEEPNQTKALQNMGVEMPHPNQKRGQTNNELVTFTEELRECWQDIIERTDPTIDIDREVKSPSSKHKSHLEHKMKKLEERVAELENKCYTMDSMRYEGMEAFIRERGLKERFEDFYREMFINRFEETEYDEYEF